MMLQYTTLLVTLQHLLRLFLKLYCGLEPGAGGWLFFAHNSSGCGGFGI